MDDKSTGGPAFPGPRGSKGMTMRDFFAAGAMRALLAEKMFSAASESAKDAGKTTPMIIAAAAYEMADAMLEVRK